MCLYVSCLFLRNGVFMTFCQCFFHPFSPLFGEIFPLWNCQGGFFSPFWKKGSYPKMVETGWKGWIFPPFSPFLWKFPPFPKTKKKYCFLLTTFKKFGKLLNLKTVNLLHMILCVMQSLTKLNNISKLFLKSFIGRCRK